jgi:uncharacterized protein
MSESLLEFPCDFPLKVMGRKEPGFSETIVALVETHAGPLDVGRVRLRESRDGNFVALTIVVRPGSQEELDTIYGVLSAHDQVLIVL